MHDYQPTPKEQAVCQCLTEAAQSVERALGHVREGRGHAIAYELGYIAACLEEVQRRLTTHFDGN